MLNPQSDLSVVMTCYREGRLLLEGIQSVLSQSILPREIILVNDASPDEATNQVCRELEKQGDVTVLWQAQNGGPSIARNAGFAAASGAILVPLDADDLLPEGALAAIAAAFDAHPDAGFIYGSYSRQDRPGENRLVLAKPLTLREMLRSRPFSLSSNWQLIGTAPLRKWLWEAVGQSDAHMGAADLHDVEFWMRAMALPCAHYPTDEVIYIWRKYFGQNSKKVTPMAWYRVAKKHFSLYEKEGLAYRAHELLLLGSKWMGDRDEIRHYRRCVWQHIRQGEGQFSTIAAFLIPARLFRRVAIAAGRQR